MNKKLITINIIITILLVITSICTILFFFSNNSNSSSDWFKQSGKGYTVVGKRIGEPSWGGTSKALIEIYDAKTNTIILQFETGINTNGNSLSDNNYNISINDDHIALIFYNENESISGSYRFYYEDFKGVESTNH